MSSIEWGSLTRPVYDQVVEDLFLAENADIPEDAFAVNGRGGDGGIDIHVRRDGRLTIVQLKFFPEGFSGGFRDTRQRQISASFESALKHDPDEWWLVVPTTLTAAERRFAVGLPQKQTPKLKKPKVIVFDRTKLDGLAASHPDLVAYFKRDELREAAKDYNQERALLVDQDDVLARVAALSKQADTLHPDWRLDFFTDGDVVGTMLVARHPRAAERSPVTLSLEANFGPDQEELRKSFERAMAYGTPDRVELPESVVTNFTVDGPEFLAHSSDDVSVTWVPSNPDSAGRPFSLVFYNDRDVVIASFLGNATWVGAAHLGASVHVSFFDAVRLEFLLPFDRSNPVQMDVKVTLGGCDPRDVVRAVSILEQLEAGPSVGLELEGVKLGRLVTGGQSKSPFGESRTDIVAHKEVAADLVVIQDATSRYFPYPEKVEFADRVYVRCLRLLLEGECVVMPGQREVTPKLNGNDSSTVRQLLSGEYMSLIIEMENYGQELMGHDVYVGPGRVYAPQIAAVDAPGALAALDADEAEGLPVTLRARDGYGFWVFLPDRHKGPADGRLRPVGLGLPDFADDPDVARALIATDNVDDPT